PECCHYEIPNEDAGNVAGENPHCFPILAEDCPMRSPKSAVSWLTYEPLEGKHPFPLSRASACPHDPLERVRGVQDSFGLDDPDAPGRRPHLRQQVRLRDSDSVHGVAARRTDLP